MHPLKHYISNLRIASETPEEYEKELRLLAGRIGISSGKLVRLHYENQDNVSPEKGLRLELATNGLVPADTVSDCQHIIDLVHKVDEMRINNG